MPHVCRLVWVPALGLVIPYFLTHYLDYRKNFWGIGGGARKLLQENLFRKYLHYDEVHRKDISAAEFTNCINNDVHKLVGKGFMNFFALASSTSKLVWMLGFQIYLAVDSPLLSRRALTLIVTFFS